MASLPTVVLDLAAAPVQVNAGGRNLGPAGEPLLLHNVGDDPIFWAIAESAPDHPGFRLRRAAGHQISTPTVGLWAWAPSGSRILAQPLGGDVARHVPSPTIALTLGRDPVQVASPARTGSDRRSLLYNASAAPIFTIQAAPDEVPETAVTLNPLQQEETLPMGWVPDTSPAILWAWTTKFAGAVALVQSIGDGWEI